jgi:hypothetical protein
MPRTLILLVFANPFIEQNFGQTKPVCRLLRLLQGGTQVLGQPGMG